jgi:hypothetical protein
VFFAGAYSHAVLKRPRPGDFRAQEDFGGTREPFRPSIDQLRQAREIVERVAPVLYARVDVVDVGGAFVLMELELIDPVLFLAYDAEAPPAARRRHRRTRDPRPTLGPTRSGRPRT